MAQNISALWVRFLSIFLIGGLFVATALPARAWISGVTVTSVADGSGETLHITAEGARFSLENLQLVVVNEATGERESLRLREISSDGVGTAALRVARACGTSADDDGVLWGAPGVTLTVRWTYEDVFDGTLSDQVGHTLTGTLDAVTLRPALARPGEPLAIEFHNGLVNGEPAVAERLDVPLVNIATGEREVVSLVESGPDTGLFQGTLATSQGPVAGADGDGVLAGAAGQVVELIHQRPASCGGALRATAQFASPIAARFSAAEESWPASDLVGAVAGTFGVNASGIAGYNVPITVPAGTAGLKPDLVLSFSGRGAQGQLGVGGAIGGLSVISRCPVELHMDGFIDPVDFDANDKYCLNGQRLVPVAGAYGADGTEYRTSFEDFSKIVSYGRAGSGPAWFKVWKKSGRILEFGNSGDSRIEAPGRADARAWAMNRITDRAGNYIEYSYFEDNGTGEYGLERVSYTGNSAHGLAPYAHVEFLYEDRSASRRPVAYAAGDSYLLTRRLSQVRVIDDHNPVRTYALAYSSGRSTNLSRVSTVTECDGAGNCLAPTRLNWSDNYYVNPGMRKILLAGDEGIPGTALEKYTIGASGDFNGDGRTDLYVFKADLQGRATGNTTTDYVWLADGDGTFTKLALGTGNASVYQGRRVAGVGDFNGDGLTDIYFYKATESGRSEGNNTIDNLWLSKGDGTFRRFSLGSGSTSIPKNYVVGATGDFNGDGRTDLYFYKARVDGRANSDNSTDFVWLSDGDGTFTRLATGTGPTSLYQNQRIGATGDFNGDGLADLYVYVSMESGRAWGNNADRVWLANGDGTFRRQIPGSGRTLLAHDHRIVGSGDFNGDGLSDLAIVETDTYGRMVEDQPQMATWLARGDGTFAPPVHTRLFSAAGRRIGASGDFNGDGRVDLLVHAADQHGRAGDGGLYDRILVAGLTGAFTQNVGRVVRQQRDRAGVVSGDFNGDGLTDLYIYEAYSSGRFTGNADDMVRLSDADIPDMLTGIENGLGLETRITYKPLTDPDVYTKGSGAVYPAVDVVSPAQVVSLVEVSDGIGGFNGQAYRYEGLRTHLVGWGNLGFAAMSVTDVPTGIVARSLYSQDHANHFQGLLTRSQSIAPDGTVLEDRSVTWSVSFLPTADGTLRCFRYTPSSTTTRRDLNGTLIATAAETSAYDSHGFLTMASVTASNGADTTTTLSTNTYAHDVGSWSLGRLTAASVIHSAPGTPDIVRRSAFTYDASGLLASETVEPGDPLSTTKTYKRNGFGAIMETTETWAGTGQDGIGPTSRVSSLTYDARGRRVVGQTNALGHTASHLHDGPMGAVSASTGPNGLTTAWAYDPFGRKIAEIRADGTQTNTHYYACDGSIVCPPHAVLAIVAIADGAPIAAQYQDRLYRVVRKSAEGLDGRLVHVDTEFDAKGRVARRSEPFFDADTPLWTSVAYDLLGRPLTTTRPDGTTQSVVYDGLTRTSTNEVGQTKTLTSNVAAKMVTVRDAIGATTSYTYDAIGRLIAMADPHGNLSTFAYDVMGNKIAASDPDKGSWSYRYNALGLLIEQLDAKGQATRLTYDVAGRMLSRIDDADGPDPAARTATWSYDGAPMGLGKLDTASGGGTRLTQSYDSYGRPLSATRLIDGQAYTISTTYDGDGRASELVYPSGLRARNVYNYFGHKVAIEDAVGGTLWWQAKAADARGNLTHEEFANGIERHKTFAASNGRLAAIFAQGYSGPVQDLRLSFDALGNLTERADNVRGQVEQFAYDRLNRLREVNLESSLISTLASTGASAHGGQPILQVTMGHAPSPVPITATTTLAMSYDALGNIVYKSDVGAYTYGDATGCTSGHAGPHAVSSVAGARTAQYCYDANGDMVSGDGRTVRYSAFGKPLSISRAGTTTSFAYGPDRSRFKRLDSGPLGSRTTHYVGGKLYEVVIDETGTERRKHIIAGTVLVTHSGPVAAPLVETRYILTDHLGSTDVITDAAGAVIEPTSFDAWGQRRNAADWSAPPLSVGLGMVATTRGFTGHEQLDGLGLVHMNGRVYDPLLGRFLSADPVIQDLSNLQSWNRYTYVLNNPLSFTDPSGFFFKSLFRAIGKLFSAIFKFIGQNLKVILRLAIIAVACNPFTLAVCLAVTAATAFGFTLMDGGTLGQAFQAAAFAVASAIIWNGAGQFLGSVASSAARISAAGYMALKATVHGVVGGALSLAQGGNFFEGFAANALGAIAGIHSQRVFGFNGSGGFAARLGRTLSAAVAGGMGAIIAGGKFANGALTAGFAHLFNAEGMLRKVRPNLFKDLAAAVKDPGRFAQCSLDCAREVLGNGTVAKLGVAVSGGNYLPTRGKLGGATPEPLRPPSFSAVCLVTCVFHGMSPHRRRGREACL